jgi:elongation factor G
MDIMGADFYNVVNMVKERLHANGVPIQLPIGAEDTFRGIIDLMNMKAEIYYDEMGKEYGEEEIPADMLEKAKEYRANMVEAIAETDEDLMMAYRFVDTNEPTFKLGVPVTLNMLHTLAAMW